MKLIEVEQMAMNTFQAMGCGGVNLAFFSAPWPLGFCHRNWIGLNELFCRMHGRGPVFDCLLHEITHYHAPEDAGHGDEFKRTAERIGGVWEYISSDRLDPEFAKLHIACDTQKEYTSRLTNWLTAIFRKLDERADAGIKGQVDYKSFMELWKIDGYRIMDLDPKHGEAFRAAARAVGY